MARKRKTTALPKKAAERKVTPTEAAEEGSAEPRSVRDRFGLINTADREFHSRAEREAQIQRLVLLATGAIIGLLVIILSIAIIVDGLVIPSQSVAVVNDAPISVADFQQRVRLERAIIIEQLNNALNDYIEENDSDLDTAGQVVISQEPFATWWNELNVPDQMGIRVLEDMVDEQLLRAQAEAQGISVSDEEIDAKINDFIGYDPDEVAAIGTDPTPTSSPSPTATPFVTATASATPLPTATFTPTFTPIGAAAADDEVSTEDNTDVTDDTAANEADTDVETDESAAEDSADADAPTPTIEIAVTAAPTPTPTATSNREETEQFYQDRREDFLSDVQRAAGVGEDAIRDYFEALVLSEKLVAAEAAIDSVVIADVRHILVNTEEEAQEVLDALANGESFADLARALSQDTGSGIQGGELGEGPTYRYVTEFAQAVETAAVGEIVGPVESQFGFHIIQVRSRSEREAEQVEIDDALNRQLTLLIEDTREAQADAFEIYSNWVDYVPSQPSWLYEERS